MSKVGMSMEPDYSYGQQQQQQYPQPPPQYNFSQMQQPPPPGVLPAPQMASSPWMVQANPSNPSVMMPGQIQPGQGMISQSGQMPGQTLVTNINVPGFDSIQMMGPEPMRIICPHCGASIQTRTEKTPSCMAYAIGTVIALLGCIYGCCLIPCCIDSCMNVQHNCPNCQAFIGQFRP